MIHSMTAFARNQSQGKWGSLVCEMRSINHRYLEISTHLSEMVRGFEMPIRERIRDLIKRGKIECSIRYQSTNAHDGAMFTVNTTLVEELCKASETVSKLLGNAAPIYPTDILRFPGVLETNESDTSELEAALFQLLDKTITDLGAARGREGEELKKTFTDRLALMQQEMAKVKERLPSVITEAKERLNKRFLEAKVELDPSRLEQELVFFAQKIDIAEEIDRTQTHINEIQRILKEGGVVGRRLDFLMQELNREANTMGSKSVDPVITHAAVEMKVLIEQVREQVQNVE